MASIKISALTEATSVAVTDILPVVIDPGTTPTTKKVTVANLFKGRVFGAGSASAGTAPIKLTSGTVMTTPEAGAIEYDGKAMYATLSTGARGAVQVSQFAMVDSDFTLTNSTTAQAVFPTGYDVFTLDAATTYLFEGTYYLTTGSTSHIDSMLFVAGGSLSFTSIHYTTISLIQSITNVPTAPQMTIVDVATEAAVTAAGTSATRAISFKGIMRINAGGTVTPQIKFSAAPGGTNLTKVGSYIRFTPVGSNTVTKSGNVA